MFRSYVFNPRTARREMENLHNEMNRLFYRSRPSRRTEYPALNAWVNDDKVIVTAELPGFEVKDLDISVVNKTLTLNGERKAVELNENEKFHRQERTNGAFQRTAQLPFEVDVEKVEATFNKGILSITLPKAEAEKPRKIKVNVSK